MNANRMASTTLRRGPTAGSYRRPRRSRRPVSGAGVADVTGDVATDRLQKTRDKIEIEPKKADARLRAHAFSDASQKRWGQLSKRFREASLNRLDVVRLPWTGRSFER